MNKKINRRQIVISNSAELEKSDREYWENATLAEKLRTITYLRECFYGDEATTGRLQRFYTIFKRS